MAAGHRDPPRRRNANHSLHSKPSAAEPTQTRPRYGRRRGLGARPRAFIRSGAQRTSDHVKFKNKTATVRACSLRVKTRRVGASHFFGGSANSCEKKCLGSVPKAVARAAGACSADFQSAVVSKSTSLADLPCLPSFPITRTLRAGFQSQAGWKPAATALALQSASSRLNSAFVSNWAIAREVV